MQHGATPCVKPPPRGPQVSADRDGLLERLDEVGREYLAACMNEGVAPALQPWYLDHRLLAGAMKELAATGEAIGADTLDSHLRAQGNLDKLAPRNRPVDLLGCGLQASSADLGADLEQVGCGRESPHLESTSDLSLNEVMARPTAWPRIRGRGHLAVVHVANLFSDPGFIHFSMLLSERYGLAGSTRCAALRRRRRDSAPREPALART